MTLLRTAGLVVRGVRQWRQWRGRCPPCFMEECAPHQSAHPCRLSATHVWRMLHDRHGVVSSTLARGGAACSATAVQHGRSTSAHTRGAGAGVNGKPVFFAAALSFAGQVDNIMRSLTDQLEQEDAHDAGAAPVYVRALVQTAARGHGRHATLPTRAAGASTVLPCGHSSAPDPEGG